MATLLLLSYYRDLNGTVRPEVICKECEDDRTEHYGEDDDKTLPPNRALKKTDVYDDPECCLEPVCSYCGDKVKYENLPD